MNTMKIADVVNGEGKIVSLSRGPLKGLQLWEARHEAKALNRLAIDGPFTVANIREKGSKRSPSLLEGIMFGFGGGKVKE